MTPPDVIGDDGKARRGFRVAVPVIVLAGVVGLLVNAAHGDGSRKTAVPTSAPTFSPAPRLPDVIVQQGYELDVVRAGESQAIGTLPFAATDVRVTTLPAFTPGEHLVHVFGLAGGNAFRLEIGPAETLRDDLGPAVGILETDEAPVLVHEGNPVTVSGPYGSGQAALPAGWRPAGFENLDYAGILTRRADAAGNVEIASWSPGGEPHVLASSGRLLGVTDAGQAIWLDPSCPAGQSCALFFGDIGGLHPADGIRAPDGVRFSDGSVAYGVGGYLAVTAVQAAGRNAGTPVIVIVNPWQATARVVPGSAGVVAGAGMFWADAHDLAFVADDPAPGVRLLFYDANAESTTPFGLRLPTGIRLLTAYGAADSAEPALSR